MAKKGSSKKNTKSTKKEDANELEESDERDEGEKQIDLSENDDSREDPAYSEDVSNESLTTRRSKRPRNAIKRYGSPVMDICESELNECDEQNEVEKQIDPSENNDSGEDSDYFLSPRKAETSGPTKHSSSNVSLPTIPPNQSVGSRTEKVVVAPPRINPGVTYRYSKTLQEMILADRTAPRSRAAQKKLIILNQLFVNDDKVFQNITKVAQSTGMKKERTTNEQNHHPISNKSCQIPPNDKDLEEVRNNKGLEAPQYFSQTYWKFGNLSNIHQESSHEDNFEVDFIAEGPSNVPISVPADIYCDSVTKTAMKVVTEKKVLGREKAMKELDVARPILPREDSRKLSSDSEPDTESEKDDNDEEFLRENQGKYAEQDAEKKLIKPKPSSNVLELVAAYRLMSNLQTLYPVELATFEGRMYGTYLEAAKRRGFMDGMMEWDAALNELSDRVPPFEVRQNFVQILMTFSPSKPLALFLNHRDRMLENNKNWSKEQKIAHALYHIQLILRSFFMSLEDFQLDLLFVETYLPPNIQEGENRILPVDLPRQGGYFYCLLCDAQEAVVETIRRLVESRDEDKILFVHCPDEMESINCFERVFPKCPGTAMAVVARIGTTNFLFSFERMNPRVPMDISYRTINHIFRANMNAGIVLLVGAIFWKEEESDLQKVKNAVDFIYNAVNEHGYPCNWPEGHIKKHDDMLMVVVQNGSAPVTLEEELIESGSKDNKEENHQLIHEKEQKLQDVAEIPPVDDAIMPNNALLVALYEQMNNEALRHFNLFSLTLHDVYEVKTSPQQLSVNATFWLLYNRARNHNSHENNRDLSSQFALFHTTFLEAEYRIMPDNQKTEHIRNCVFFADGGLPERFMLPIHRHQHFALAVFGRDKKEDVNVHLLDSNFHPEAPIMFTEEEAKDFAEHYYENIENVIFERGTIQQVEPQKAESNDCGVFMVHNADRYFIKNASPLGRISSMNRENLRIVTDTKKVRKRLGKEVEETFNKEKSLMSLAQQPSTSSKNCIIENSEDKSSESRYIDEKIHSDLKQNVLKRSMPGSSHLETKEVALKTRRLQSATPGCSTVRKPTPEMIDLTLPDTDSSLEQDGVLKTKENKIKNAIDFKNPWDDKTIIISKEHTYKDPFDVFTLKMMDIAKLSIETRPFLNDNLIMYGLGHAAQRYFPKNPEVHVLLSNSFLFASLVGYNVASEPMQIVVPNGIISERHKDILLKNCADVLDEKRRKTQRYKNTFSKDVLYFPVVYQRHWTTAIVLNPAGAVCDIDTTNKSPPCTLIFFNSYQRCASHVLAVSLVLKTFLETVFKEYNNDATKYFDVSRIVTEEPAHLPQQPNDSNDCGLYLIAFSANIFASIDKIYQMYKNGQKIDWNHICHESTPPIDGNIRQDAFLRIMKDADEEKRQYVNKFNLGFPVLFPEN